ncbi:unnamed protein product [Mucor circinelloides]
MSIPIVSNATNSTNQPFLFCIENSYRARQSMMAILFEYRRLDLPSIPDDLIVYLDSYDVQWASAKDLYLFAERQQHDPVDEFDKKWVKESILRMAELFLYSDELDLNNFSEADLLHDVWSFIYRAFRDKQVKALLGEVASGAVSLAKNKGRCLESKEKRQRKAMGARLDIMFKIGKQEYGTCEVGKSTVTVADDKYLDDDLVKVPKTLRDMLALLVQKNQRMTNSLYTVGFVVMALCLGLVVLDVPVGSHIARITRIARFEFPSSVENMPVDCLPLLELVYKGKQAMIMAKKITNDRKRKEVELLGSDRTPSFPPSFYD